MDSRLELAETVTDVQRPTPPLTLQHLALHLSKDAGLLAAAAEKMDHEDEQAEGRLMFEEWMTKRRPNVYRTLALLESDEQW